MPNGKWLILIGCTALMSCSKLSLEPRPEKTKLYDAVVFEVTRARVMTAPGIQDSAEFVKNIADRTQSRVGPILKGMKKHDLVMTNTCGSRTMKVVSDLSTVTFSQKAKGSYWRPTAEVTQRLRVSTEGTVIDCVSGNTIAKFTSNADDDDYSDVMNELADNMAEAAIKAQWSR